MTTDEEKYKETEAKIKAQIPNQTRAEQTKKTTPDTAIETAHILLSNTPTTNLMQEVDKEVKLSNLDATEKFGVFKNIQVYHDLLWTIKEQNKKEFEAEAVYGEVYKKYPETRNDEILVEQIQNEMDSADDSAGVFDKVGLLRMGIFIPVLSRGKLGFERTKQVETIQSQRTEYQDKTETKPGFLGFFGGKKGTSNNTH
jgi:hypothetical protein